MEKRRQLEMPITWRGSIALRGNLSTTKGRARRVDLQNPGDFFRARCPPVCLPPTPKLKLSVVGGQPGGAPGGQGRCPWTPRSALHDGHENWRGRWPPTLSSRKLSEILPVILAPRSKPEIDLRKAPQTALTFSTIWHRTLPNFHRKLSPNPAELLLGFHSS